MERKFKRFHHLTYTDRLKIEQMYNGGAGIQEIADALRVNYTTVYRELKRPGVMYDHLNGDYTTDKHYSADIAQQQYEYGKTAKGRPIKLGNDYALADYIERKIADEGRSPAAVLMDIELEGKQFSVRVCEKTIYNYITNGVFLNITNKDLPLHGETKRGYNRVRSASRPPQGESIERRPEEINQREEPFHWEMDTVKGKQKTKKCVLTLTERLSRNEITLPMYGATMENVVAALNGLERKYGALFSKIFRSITVDNGSEFADCEGMERSCLTKRARTHIYYCHPYSAFERGSNENANSLIRRWLPKGTKLSEVSQAEIKQIQIWMNNYPRMVLGGRCANTALAEWMAAEGVLLPLVHI